MYAQQIIGFGLGIYTSVNLYKKIQDRCKPKKPFPLFKMPEIPIVLSAREVLDYAHVNQLTDQLKPIIPKIQDFLSIDGKTYIQGTMDRAEDFVTSIKGLTRDMINVVPDIEFSLTQIADRAKNIGGEGAIITQMGRYDEIQALGGVVDRIVDDHISLDFVQQQLFYAGKLIGEYFDNIEDYKEQIIGLGSLVKLSIPEIAKFLGGLYVVEKFDNYFIPNNTTEDTNDCEMDIAGEVNEL